MHQSGASLPPRSAVGRRQVLTKRSCVAVLTGLAAFAALQVVAAVALERRLPGMIDPDYGARLSRIRKAHADHAKNALTVVMLGSSRTYHGMASDELHESLSRALGRQVSVVNAGLPGAGPFTELFLWRRLRRDGVRPDLLLVEVLPGLVSDARTVHDLSEDRMPADHLLWSDLPLLERYQAGTRTCLRRAAIVSEAATLYTHRFGILHALMPCLLSDHGAALVTPPGPSFIPDDPSPDQRARALDFARREYVPALIESNPDSSAGRVLHELLASCRQARSRPLWY